MMESFILPAWQFLLEEGLAALRYPLSSGRRIYAVYLLGAILLAGGVFLYRYRRIARRSPRQLLTYLFSPRIWWHPSARMDYKILLLNPIFGAGLASFLGLSLVPIALWVSDGLGAHLGAARPGFSPLTVTALFTLALFLADDFTRFLLHWLMHKLPALWEIHRLHHSAEVLTPATIYRIHPLESFLYSMRLVLTQGVVLGIFFYGFGMRLSAWEVAGANAFTWFFNFAGANLRHSHVWLSFGPWLEYLFISPAQHQIHHSAEPRHFDRNFGAFLAIWDTLFGSLHRAAGDRRPRAFGLGRGQGNPHRRLLAAYGEPVAGAMRSLLRPLGVGRKASPVQSTPEPGKIASK